MNDDNSKSLSGCSESVPLDDAGSAPGQPFYWSQAPSLLLSGGEMAPTGWYQWTPKGLIYLGDCIMECAFCGDIEMGTPVTCKICKDVFCEQECVDAHLIGPPTCGGPQ